MVGNVFNFRAHLFFLDLFFLCRCLLEPPPLEVVLFALEVVLPDVDVAALVDVLPDVDVAALVDVLAGLVDVLAGLVDVLAGLVDVLLDVDVLAGLVVVLLDVDVLAGLVDVLLDVDVDGLLHSPNTFKYLAIASFSSYLTLSNSPTNFSISCLQNAIYNYTQYYFPRKCFLQSGSY